MLADLAREGLASWWGPLLAFAAGLISCASPCVFPLVPGYVTFVAGSGAAGERRRLLPILLFIGGFTIVFTALSLFARSLVPVLDSREGKIVEGAVIFVLGLLMILYALGRGPLALFAERRPFLERARLGTVGALPLGMAFAAGWSPCLGPVLSGILALAAGSGSSIRAAVLLISYSAGLGVPFLLVGLGIQRLEALNAVQRHYRWISALSGVLLVGIGILVATGELTRVFAPLISRFTPAL
jgi:cytochrome c-type biogenesis protein